jgi:very-short-patch-repair endonuclease
MYRDQEQRDFARELRNQPTDAEKRLWHFLRAGKLGVKFRRQAAIGAYITDFVCFSHRLIVELDAPQHIADKGKERDARRTAWLTARGFRVIRFRNQALDEDIWGVVEEIKRALRDSELDVRQPPSPALPSEGEGAGQMSESAPLRGPPCVPFQSPPPWGEG